MDQFQSAQVDQFQTARITSALAALGPRGDAEFILLAVEVDAEALPPHSESCRLLGFDLCDDTYTSTLLNCGPWVGELGQFAGRSNEYGLLTHEDARLAQALLPTAWPNEPHAKARVWALYELHGAPTSAART